MRIRHATPEDASGFINLHKALDAKSSFMLFESGERAFDLAAETEKLRRIIGSDYVAVFVAVLDEQLAGFAGVTRYQPRRASKSAKLATGVRADFYRRGVGTQLLAAVEEWARARGVARLELTVMESNHSAIGLYKKLEFVEEGLRRNSLWVDGAAVNELYMGKLLAER